jgi:muramoyltetrapeptide carboxypeptidase
MPQNRKINIIAPSFKIPNSDLKECLKGLKSLNIDYSLKEPLFSSKELCAHTKDKRFNDLKLALNSNSDYLWCLRGGYGCLHLVEDLLSLPKPKVMSKLIGFSDITVLHYILNQKWNWPSLHWKHLNGFLIESDNLKNLGSQKSNSEKTKPSANVTKIFDGKKFEKALTLLKTSSSLNYKIKALNVSAMKVKSIQSSIVGGNLITLQSLVGLDIPKPKDQILFFEEIDEPIYKLDRAFTQLEMNGWLKNIKGLILGSFSHKNKEVEAQTQKYLKHKFKDFKIPVFSGLKSGHIPDQVPLFFNTNSEIKNENGRYILNNKNGFI